MYSTFLFVKFFWYSHTQSKCSNQKDREFVELEIPYNGQPKRPGSPSPMASPAHSTNSAAGLLQSCCGRCCSQRYQVSCPSVNTYIHTIHAYIHNILCLLNVRCVLMCVCACASFCLCVLPLCVCRWVLKYYFSYKYLKYLAVCCFRLCVSIMCISLTKNHPNRH